MIRAFVVDVVVVVVVVVAVVASAISFRVRCYLKARLIKRQAHHQLVPC